MMEEMNTQAGQKRIVAEISALREILTRKNSMALYMAVNTDKLIDQYPDVYEPWQRCFSDSKNTKNPNKSE